MQIVDFEDSCIDSNPVNREKEKTCIFDELEPLKNSAVQSPISVVKCLTCETELKQLLFNYPKL